MFMVTTLDNFIYGNDGENEIFGGAGDDVILGGAGDDYIKGGSGDDILDGNAGADKVLAREVMISLLLQAMVMELHLIKKQMIFYQVVLVTM